MVIVSPALPLHHTVPLGHSRAAKPGKARLRPILQHVLNWGLCSTCVRHCTHSAHTSCHGAHIRFFSVYRDPDRRLRCCGPGPVFGELDEHGAVGRGLPFVQPDLGIDDAVELTSTPCRTCARCSWSRGEGSNPSPPRGPPSGGPSSSASSTRRLKVCRLATPSPIPSPSSHPSLPHPSPTLPPL